MNDRGKRHIAILVIALIISIIIVREAFKLMELSIKDYPKFQYKGKTPKADWYAYATPLAKVVGKEYGIPWPAMVVQSALETGYGKSTSVKYNNFFGVKDTDGKNSNSSPTKEFLNGKWVTIVDGFEGWKTPYDGFVGYAQFIHKNKRYANALKYPKDSYKYLEEIKKAGYATSPNYVSILHKMLNENFA